MPGKPSHRPLKMNRHSQRRLVDRQVFIARHKIEKSSIGGAAPEPPKGPSLLSPKDSSWPPSAHHHKRT
jgi:hypothetical protein